MKYITEENQSSSYSIKATDPGRWDGAPRYPTFVLDHVPQALTADRLAVAITLLFGRYQNGVVDYPQRINLVTLAAIQDYLAPARIAPHDIDEGPKRVEQGSASLKVEVDDFTFSDLQRLGVQERSLVLLPRSTGRGSISLVRSRVVATNAHLFSGLYGELAGLLASAVLLASEMNAADIILPESKIMRSKVPVLRNLLSAVGLNLIEDQVVNS